MAAPCTMILLDPDLDPDPAPRSSSAKRVGASASPPKSLNLKVPSARSLARFLSRAQAAVGLRGEVTVLLTTNAATRKLNRRFRGKNKTTDVLSFPAGTTGPEKIAGDLAISVDTARRQGTACGHSLGTELKILMLHGLLHLAGYDHEIDAGRMARRERLLRGRLNLPQGLIERAGTLHAENSAQVPGSPTLATEKYRKDGARSISSRSSSRQTTARVRHIAGAQR